MTADHQDAEGRVERDSATVERNVRKIHRVLEQFAEQLGVSGPGSLNGQLPQGVATVVVVGEPKNGKSTLVNALVEHPSLSPVDYSVATATYISLRHGNPGARVFPEGSETAEEIHLDEVPLWTSASGLAENPRASKIPRPVEVSLPAPILEHLTIVDTPGVGGFDGSHDRATIAALTGATALVFCADGSRPMSEPELGFLAEATGSITSVVFVLTKVDQQPEWRAVLADNQARIASVAPSFDGAPWFPVASPLAERSLSSDLTEQARRALRERSGIDALSAHLRTQVAARAQMLTAANTVKELLTVANHLRSAAGDRLSLLDSPTEDTGERLRSQQVELERLASLEDGWRTDLDLGLTQLRSAELNHLDRTLRDLGEAATKDAKDTSVPADALSGRLNSELDAAATAISERIMNDTDRHIREIVGDAVETPAFAAAIEFAMASDEVVELRAGRDLLVEGRLQPSQTMPLVMSGTSGFMLANYTGLGALFGSVAVPGIGLAVAATATAVMFARRQSKVNERIQWVQGRIAESRIDAQAVIDQRIHAAKTLALRAVREWIRSRQSELKASIGELHTQMQRDDSERQASVAEAQKRVDELDNVISTSKVYIDHLRAAGR